MGCPLTKEKKQSQRVKSENPLHIDISNQTNQKDKDIQQPISQHQKQHPPKQQDPKQIVPQQIIEKPKRDSIQQLYEELCLGSEDMNDEKLFDFIGNKLEISEDDQIIGFILIQVMGLKKIENIKQQNFKALFNYSSATNINDLKNSIGEMRKKFQQDSIYHKVYSQLFNLYSGDKTTIEMEVAEQLWIVYLKGKLKWYDQFKEYLEGISDKQSMKVHRDLWNMMFQFSSEVKSLSSYNQNDGWPVFIDNFIQFLQQKAK